MNPVRVDPRITGSDGDAATTASRALRIVVWGTYDTGKPRTRILLKGLRRHGVEISEIHREVWCGVEDKSQVRGLMARSLVLFRWLGAYPGLVARLLRMPRHDVVLVPYLGLLDVILLWPFARLRGIPVMWDAFLSIYNTVVEDRRMVSPRNPIALLLWAMEWLACRAANRVIVDTAAHAQYFEETFGVDAARLVRVFVGAETDVFWPRPFPAERRPKAHFTVLFYGQFIPLHGIETVVRAAKLTEGDGVHWQVIGTGQEATRIRALIAELMPTNLTWTEWVPYTELLDWMHRADLCLGIFGTTGKAMRVIPNKVFQGLAAGCHVVTADTPAVRELSPAIESGALTLVPAGDPLALAQTVVSLALQAEESPRKPTDDLATLISPVAVSLDLVVAAADLVQRANRWHG